MSSTDLTYLPQAPGALIGYRNNGQPIYLAAGGSGEDEPPADPTPTEPPPSPTAPPAAPVADPTPEPPAAQPPAQPSDVSQLPDWAQKLIADTRKEAGDNRVKLREQEAAAKAAQTAAQEAADKHQAMLDTIAKGLGLKDDDTPPDPAKLAQQLADAQAEKQKLADEARRKDVELAVLQQAGRLDANGAALLDSRAFLSKVAKLDPAADDFTDKIGEAITAAVEANGQYKLTPATPPKVQPTAKKSGGEFTSPPEQPRQWTEDDVKAATPAQVQDAINKGLLEQLGFGKARRSKR